MMCDIVIAADDARFGQPEIKLGIIPGAGGTQRLPRAVGKAKAMDMILTGRMMNAEEAERAGLVSRIVPRRQAASTKRSAVAADDLRILAAVGDDGEGGGQPRVRRHVADGVHFERRLFHSLFATEDQKIGMQAFIDKQKPAVQAQ